MLLCLLACIVMDEKLSITFIFVPLYVICLCHSLLQIFFTFSHGLVSNLIVTWIGGVFFVFIMAGVCWVSVIYAFISLQYMFFPWQLSFARYHGTSLYPCEACIWPEFQIEMLWATRVHFWTLISTQWNGGAQRRVSLLPL